MNRLDRHSRPRLRLPGIALSALLCLGAALLMKNALDTVSDSTRTERLHSLEQAVRRATVQCYAMEGQYPQSLAYLEEHYALLINRDEFVVHYETVGENLMPVIEVFPLVEEAQ